jgi:hypothetical protein
MSALDQIIGKLPESLFVAYRKVGRRLYPVSLLLTLLDSAAPAWGEVVRTYASYYLFD